MTTGSSDLSERVSALLAEARNQIAEEDDAELLILLLHRTAVELNKAARSRATALKGSPEWGTWAGLQNTTRGLVLQASTCRDMLGKLKASRQATSKSDSGGSAT
jgi:hypothetical protein